MKTASGRVPEDLYDWLEEKGETTGSSKAKVLREALTNARAVENGEKVLADLPERDTDRLAQWGVARGLTPKEAAEEILRDVLALEDNSGGQPLSSYVEQLENENEELRQRVENPSVGEWILATKRQSYGIKSMLTGGAATTLFVIFFALITLTEELRGVGSLSWIPEWLILLLLALPIAGLALISLGVLFQLLVQLRDGLINS